MFVTSVATLRVASSNMSLTTHKKLAVLMALFVGAIVLIPLSARAEVVKMQVLNNIGFPTSNSTDYRDSVSAVGLFATGTVVSGVQLQFGNVNATIGPDNLAVALVRYDSEIAFNNCRLTPINGCTGVDVGTVTFLAGQKTDPSGFLVANFGNLILQGSPYFYAIRINVSGGVTGYGLTHIMGTDLVIGPSIFYGSNFVSTSTPATFYYQLFSGSSPTSFFTPSPTYQGFASTTLASFCDSSFATSSGFLDSIGSSISNGMCRVFAFLFVPNPNILEQFGDLASTSLSKVPFSYVFGAQDIYTSLTASTTQNLPAVVINFPDISSSSPLGTIIPVQIVGLSTSTISTYLPDSIRVTLLNLQRVALWLGLVYFFYRKVIPDKAQHV